MGCNWQNRPEPEDTKKFKTHLQLRNTLDKKLKHIGKILILQVESGNVSPETEEKFANCLNRVDQAHHHLINIIKPYLTNQVITNTLISETIKNENETLKSAKAKLKDEKKRQKERYENIIAANNQTFQEEKRKCSELTHYCQILEQEKEKLLHANSNTSTSIENDSIPQENKEIVYKRKQQQLEETLKVQNDLVEDLKRQLLKCKTDLQSLRTLNHELVQRQTYYQQTHMDEESLVHQNMIQFENEKRKTQEYQDYIAKIQEQKHQEELQELQRKYNNHIQILEGNLNERNEQLQKLQQENKNLLQQISGNDANFREEWRKLEENYSNRGSLINDLKQYSSKLNQERDFFKSQSSEFQKQIQQQNVVIEKLNSDILQLENEIRQLAADLHRGKNKEQQENHVLPEQLDQAGGKRRHENQQVESSASYNLVTETQGFYKEDPAKTEEDGYIRESLHKIENIRENTEKLQKEVEKFSGTIEDKTYLHLKELLIRNIVKLDNVETEGHMVIRKRRKEVIQFVQMLLDVLNEKAIK